jgi:hypothetical protein
MAIQLINSVYTSELLHFNQEITPPDSNQRGIHKKVSKNSDNADKKHIEHTSPLESPGQQTKENTKKLLHLNENAIHTKSPNAGNSINKNPLISSKETQIPMAPVPNIPESLGFSLKKSDKPSTDILSEKPKLKIEIYKSAKNNVSALSAEDQSLLRQNKSHEVEAKTRGLNNKKVADKYDTEKNDPLNTQEIEAQEVPSEKYTNTKEEISRSVAPNSRLVQEEKKSVYGKAFSFDDTANTKTSKNLLDTLV